MSVLSAARPLALLAAALLAGPAAAQVKPLAEGLTNATSVAVGNDGRIYVTSAGQPGKAGDGAVLVIEGGKATPFAAGLDDPTCVLPFQNMLFVADGDRIWRIGKDGRPMPLTPPGAVPNPYRLRDLAADENGTLYATADGGAQGPAVFRLDFKGQVSVVADPRKTPELKAPAALVSESIGHLLVADASSGDIFRVRIADGSAEKATSGLGAGGLSYDRFGRLYAGAGDKVRALPRADAKPVDVVAVRADDVAVSADGKLVLALDARAGTLNTVPAAIPGWEVDETPLAVDTAVAFPDLKWTGWEAVSEEGKVTPLRPIVLTHAGDGSGRIFVATQQGVVHAFPGDQSAKATKVFLDIRDRVFYDDKENEQGLLGMAFHPDFKKNGELYVFYTKKDRKYVNVLSRFRLGKGDPDKADPASEEVIFSVERPYWNHDGGTVAFGPDGMLYLALGDGGAANDPFDNSQHLGTVLGKVLRLDVSRKEGDKGYAIPKDNPFVGKAGARPEVWCYGLRNVWRMSFDRKTGDLWAADVGQNLWEEINILKAGGNYGWNRREALHPFGPAGVGPSKDFIEPIWEYHHDIGKSATGGVVYRGKDVPELDGHYLVADYVSSKMWAIKYDAEKKRVVANRPIKDRGVPVMSFGEDERGEAYFMTWTPTGQGIFRFVKSGSARR